MAKYKLYKLNIDSSYLYTYELSYNNKYWFAHDIATLISRVDTFNFTRKKEVRGYLKHYKYIGEFANLELLRLLYG